MRAENMDGGHVFIKILHHEKINPADFQAGRKKGAVQNASCAEASSA